MARSQSPEPSTYFLDENLDSADLAARLTARGLSCVRLTKFGPPFRANMTDEEWIPLVAARGWWAVTRDARTTKEGEERRTILRSQAVHIVIRGKNLTTAAMAEMLVKVHPRLVAKLAKLHRPVIVDVYADSRLVWTVGARRGAGPPSDEEVDTSADV